MVVRAGSLLIVNDEIKPVLLFTSAHHESQRLAFFVMHYNATSKSDPKGVEFEIFDYIIRHLAGVKK